MTCPRIPSLRPHLLIHRGFLHSSPTSSYTEDSFTPAPPPHTPRIPSLQPHLLIHRGFLHSGPTSSYTEDSFTPAPPPHTPRIPSLRPHLLIHRGFLHSPTSLYTFHAAYKTQTKSSLSKFKNKHFIKRAARRLSISQEVS